MERTTLLHEILSSRDVWIHLLEMLEVKDLLLSMALVNRDHYHLVHGNYLMNFILHRDFKELILNHDEYSSENNNGSLNGNSSHMARPSTHHHTSCNFYGINENGYYRLPVPSWTEHSIIPPTVFKTIYLLLKSELKYRNQCCRGFICDRIFSTMWSSKLKSNIVECRHDEMVQCKIDESIPITNQTAASSSNEVSAVGEQVLVSRATRNYQFKCKQCGLTLFTTGFHPCEITKSISSGNVYYWLQPGHKYRIENVQKEDDE
ncbi:hypothetical protein C9374_009478 [Naegleria lovaniensis]|uniref:Uncharacterized protein n=1 Tax=Naegleria lovaniensis TaxID=51637 RepID=A0AA88KQZ8_NAELO|nr:uncharacterized protein C9374_009478 [Naegleria lovaniensis]KAG2392901.1 hypothetical protein C9374_009478 [Naegleria lovaniensis]